jgi:hypothetical protein
MHHINMVLRWLAECQRGVALRGGSYVSGCIAGEPVHCMSCLTAGEGALRGLAVITTALHFAVWVSSTMLHGSDKPMK